jgi:preprotein translocase subunit SecG
MLGTIKGILFILYLLVCVGLIVVVLLQEGKQAGLTGAISGAAETYWGRNKARSMEGGLVLATRILAVLFIVLSVVLNMDLFS